jgi:cytochrome bd-type quinol oxidase subunit 1
MCRLNWFSKAASIDRMPFVRLQANDTYDFAMVSASSGTRISPWFLLVAVGWLQTPRALTASPLALSLARDV